MVDGIGARMETLKTDFSTTRNELTQTVEQLQTAKENLAEIQNKLEESQENLTNTGAQHEQRVKKLRDALEEKTQEVADLEAYRDGLLEKMRKFNMRLTTALEPIARD